MSEPPWVKIIKRAHEVRRRLIDEPIAPRWYELKPAEWTTMPRQDRGAIPARI